MKNSRHHRTAPPASLPPCPEAPTDDTHAACAPGLPSSDPQSYFTVEAEYHRLLNSLRGLIHNLHARPCDEDDLIQEALLHFWLEQKKHPGHSRSWYIQSCQFC